MSTQASMLHSRALAERPNAKLKRRERHALVYDVGVDPLTGRSVEHAVFSMRPLHYREAGQWREVDLDWKDSDDPSFSDMVVAADYRVYSAPSGRRRIYPRRDRLDEYIEFQPPELQNPSGKWRSTGFNRGGRSGKKLAWVSAGASVDTITQAGQFKVNFNILDPRAVAPIRWRYNLVGLRRDNTLLVSEQEENVVGSFAPLVMTDAEGTERLVDHRLNDFAVELYPVVNDLVFPIEVDPTINISPSVSGDDGHWTEATFSSTSTAILLGNSGGSANAFIRFPNVTFPTNATITSALVSGDSQANLSVSTCNVTIRALAEDNATAPTSLADANGRTTTTAGVNWSSIPGWTTGTNYASPNISSVITEIKNRAGWASGNAIVLYFIDAASSTNARRQWYSEDHSSGAPPTLSITYATTVNYNEKDKIEALSLALTGADTIAWNEKDAAQALTLGLSGSDAATWDEKLAVQTLTLSLTGVDGVTWDEKNAVQTLTLLMSSTDTLTAPGFYDETGASLSINVSLSHADTLQASESGTQALTLSLGSIDGLAITEVAGVQTLTLALTGADAIAYNESGSQPLLLTLSGTDIYDPIDHFIETGTLDLIVDTLANENYHTSETGILELTLTMSGDAKITFPVLYRYKVLNMRAIEPYTTTVAVG